MDAPAASKPRDGTKAAVDGSDDLAFLLNHPEALVDDFEPPIPPLAADISNSSMAVTTGSSGVAPTNARSNIENATAGGDVHERLRLREAELNNLRSRLADKQREIEQVESGVMTDCIVRS